MKDTFESKDLMLSSALLATGVPLLNVRDERNYLVFIFGDSDKCKKLERQWWAGTLLVNATKYAESVKRLKGLVHSKR